MASKLPIKVESGKRKRFVAGTDFLPETIGGTGHTSFATGDLLIASGTNALGKITIGSANQVLTSNGTTAAWASATQATEIQSLTNNESGDMIKGGIVYSDGAGTCKKAKADSATTSGVVGVSTNAPAAAAAALVQVAGTVTLTTGEWDAVAGTTGGLTAGTLYFLSPATAGQYTSSAPDTTGQELFRVGRALSATQLALEFDGPDTL